MEILDSFYGFSGHRVNGHKTNIFFSSGVEEELGDRIRTMLGFENQIKELANMHLFHVRDQNASFL